MPSLINLTPEGHAPPNKVIWVTICRKELVDQETSEAIKSTPGKYLYDTIVVVAFQNRCNFSQSF